MNTLKKLLICTLASLSVIMLFTVSASAIGITPLRQTIDVVPGEIKEISTNIENTESAPVQVILTRAIVIAQGGINDYVDPSVRPEVEDTPYSMLPYYTLDKNMTSVLNPGDSEDITIKLEIPEDLTPGTYLGGILLVSGPPVDTAVVDNSGSVGIELQARIAHTFTVNVINEGAPIVEDLSLENFIVPEDLLSQGKFGFGVTIKNNGNFASTPVGTINIYAENTETPTKSLFKDVEIIDGEPIVKKFIDHMVFNQGKLSVLPHSSQSLDWEPQDSWILNLHPGKYYGEIEAYYGVSGDKSFTAKTPIFEIRDLVYCNDFNVDQKSIFASNFDFIGNITNQGQREKDGNASIIIKNIFGQNVDIIPLGNVSILAGNTHSVNSSWQASRGLGLYTATLSYTLDNSLIQSSVSFVYISWWQALLLLLILVIVLGGAYKGFSSYSELKKALREKNTQANSEDV
jgi:hypothetical protein